MKQLKKKTRGLIADAMVLKKSVREYKKDSILAPIFVAMEVILEVMIPYIMTLLLSKIQQVGEAGHADEI